MRKSFSLLLHKDGKEWVFERRGGVTRVFDSKDVLVDAFPHEDANSRFDMPSFWRSIKYITFRTGNGAVLEFRPEAEDVRIVKQYLDDAMMYHGIDAIQSYRTRAWLAIAGGALLFLGSGVTAFLIDDWARTGGAQRGSIRLFLVGMIMGVVLFAGGVATALRASRLIRRWHEQEQD